MEALLRLRQGRARSPTAATITVASIATAAPGELSGHGGLEEPVWDGLRGLRSGGALHLRRRVPAGELRLRQRP